MILRSKLRVRLAVYVSLLLVFAMVALGWVASRQFRRAMEKEIQAGLLAEASAFKASTLAHLQERAGALRTWAEDPIIRGALLFDSYEKSDETLAVDDQRMPSVVGLALLKPDGQAVSASSPELLAKLAAAKEQVASAAWFEKASARDVQVEKTPGKDPLFADGRVLHLTAPVLVGDDHHLAGYLVAAFDWGYLRELITGSLVRASARGNGSLGLYILGEDGTPNFGSKEMPEALRGSLVTLQPGETFAGDLGEWVGALTDAHGDGGFEPGWRFFATLDSGEAYAASQSVLHWMLGLIALFAVLGIAGAIMLATSVVRPIRALNEMVTRIVRDGDLTQEIAVGARDEVGELAQGFNQMVRNLREMNLNLQGSVVVLAEAVAELNEQTQAQSQMITRQAAALQETQVTAQEIRQTSMLAAQKADVVLQVAQRADEVSRSGETAIGASLTGLEQMRGQVQAIAQQISDLNERTMQIGGITQTVKDLADQSNMLALNAAIEAVRSGEHGKGFSVVAREIRTLADQSIKATDRVREILEAINGSIRSAVESTERGSERMEVGLGQMKSSGENLKELATIVSDNSSAVRQIASAVSQQNAGVAQIFTAITDLSKMMDETMVRIDSTTKATSALQVASEQMSKAAQAYRVS